MIASLRRKQQIPEAILKVKLKTFLVEEIVCMKPFDWKEIGEAAQWRKMTKNALKS